MKKYKSGLLVLIGCFIIMVMLIGVIIETDYRLNHIEPTVVYDMCNQHITWD